MTTPDYENPVLSGDGDTDYARYMRTDTLLSLQQEPEQLTHPDELVFQIVHQGTELWLKESCFEIDRAVEALHADDLALAEALMRRAAAGMKVVIEQLAVLRTLNPASFQLIRPALGHGSGAESPGWRAVTRSGRALRTAVDALLDRSAPLVEVYETGEPADLLACLEAAMDWDEQVALWRVQHYKVAIRIIGEGVRGTKGRPVEALTRMLGVTYVGRLWEVRTTLTQRGPLGDGYSQ